MSTTPDVRPKLGGRELSRTVYTAQEIDERVRAMGRAITGHYGSGEGLLVVGLLKGSFIFLADLVRAIDLPLQVDFLVASSYGDRMESRGTVELLYDPEASLEGRPVLLVEDIVDSGTTLNRVVPVLEERNPRSLEVCALLHKHVGTLVREPRWVGFDAPEDFLVGYGLDYSENYRHLPYIASL